MNPSAFTENAAKHRFEYRVGDQIAFANYRKNDGTLYIDYVEAPPELRGTGAASQLMQISPSLPASTTSKSSPFAAMPPAG